MNNRRFRIDWERALWSIALLGIALFFLVRAKKPIIPLAPLSAANHIALVNVNNDFGFRLFSLPAINLPVAGTHQPANFIISPADLEVGLGLMANGAHGETRAQMASILGWSQLPTMKVNQTLQTLAGELFSADAHVKMTSANALWLDKSCQLTAGFQHINASYFNTTVRPVRFADSATLPAINAWVNHETHGAIPTVASVGDVDDNTRLVALDALSLKNAWMEQFDPTLTMPDIFTSADGTKKNVEMMHREGAFLYAEDSIMQVVKLPCGEGKVSMVFLLPCAGQSCKTVADATFTNKGWPQLLASLHPCDVRLALPRCKITSNIDISIALQTLGMTDAFIATKADFSLLSNSPCRLKLLKHTVTVDFNENGDRPVDPKKLLDSQSKTNTPYTMLVNHPFLFATLSDDGALLLLGCVNMPV